MAFVDLLAAICIFVNCAKGISAFQLSRDLDCQYKTAFVLAHKLREAMAKGNDAVTLDGTVEIDGAYFGGHVRQENRKEDRKDRRLPPTGTPTAAWSWSCASVRAVRCPSWFCREADGAEIVRQRVALGTELHADEGHALGRTGSALPRAPDQSLAGVLLGRCLHQSGGKLLLPPAPRRHRPASPRLASSTSISTPTRPHGARIMPAATTARSTRGCWRRRCTRRSAGLGRATGSAPLARIRSCSGVRRGIN